ncbi:MAG: flagellar basal body rod protein FlgB [Candidatus Cloacimonetes bacterium]|nr:flagellar basal body rod protein FlgB [Candidatus Cloacimonadota bacterium]
MNKFLFEGTVVPELERALDVQSARHRVHANNIANVNTPCYRAREVSFETEYRRHLDRHPKPSALTHEDHIPLGRRPLDRMRPEITFADSRRNDSGLNNVDIDHEMAELAKSNMRYEMDIALIKKRFKLLRNAIRGRS